ncbi:MAG: type II secretion system protein J [Chthoniobacterales bacterium]
MMKTSSTFAIGGDDFFKITRFKKQQAFSLLELIVAISIFLLLLLLIEEVTHTTLQLWQGSKQGEQTTRETRAVMELVSKDLGSALMLTNQPTFFCDVATLDLTCRKNIFFLASLPFQARPSQDLGDLHFMGYFLTPHQFSKNQACDLYRFVTSSDATIRAIMQGSLFQLAQTASPTNRVCCESVATNVADFQVTLYWFDHGRFSKNPPNRKKDVSFLPPSLVELKIRAAGATPLQNLTFTTAITLAAQNRN